MRRKISKKMYRSILFLIINNYHNRFKLIILKRKEATLNDVGFCNSWWRRYPGETYRMAGNTEIESGGREQRDKFIIVKFGVNTLLYLKITDIIIYTALIIIVKLLFRTHL